MPSRFGSGLGFGHFKSLGFTPASLFAGTAGVWFDPSDLSTLYQSGTRASPGLPVTADGDPVGLILDKSGNANDAVQATSTKRPLYKTSGGLSWLQFDGVDDFIRATFTIAQPIDRISAIQQIAWTSAHFVFGGVAANACVLDQTGTTPSLSLYDGSAIAAGNSGATVGSDVVVTERHNGASSQLAVNNGTYSTGSPGTASPGGVTIGGDQTGVANSNVRIYGTVMIGRALTAGEIASLRTFQGSKIGTVL